MGCVEFLITTAIKIIPPRLLYFGYLFFACLRGGHGTYLDHDTLAHTHNMALKRKKWWAYI